MIHVCSRCGHGDEIALVRPAEGIVLTPEEAAFAAEAMRRSWNTTASLEWNERREALAARLEASS